MGKAQEVPILDETFDKVTGDLDTKQYFLVKASSATVALASAVGDEPLGVLQNKPKILGEAPSVRTLGLSKVKYGADVVVGDPLTTDGSGRAVKAAPGAGVNNGVWGVARSAGAVDELGTIYINPYTLQGA